jgi:ABC-2 type transport system ATP-binding protein
MAEISRGSAVEVHNLVVKRGVNRVLNGMNTTISAGVVTGLLGPSGSGKTTLMRCIVGVQKIQSGEVRVFGLAAGAPPLRRRIGYLTQAPSVYADLTVRENARYFASLFGVGAAQADRSVADVGLASAAGQLVGTLSGGQRARASLACALVSKPDLLVLDEPTVGQDPVLRNELWDQFRGLARAGATVIVSSHVMDEASRCDRLLLIRGGDLIADDTPDAVRASAGTDDLDEAFLRLVLQQEKAAA